MNGPSQDRAPGFAINNLADGAMRHAIDSREWKLRPMAASIKATNEPNICLAQFGSSVSGPARPSVTALIYGIPLVISMCAEPQMSRVDTRRIVAAMQDKYAVRDHIMGDDPGDTMRQEAFMPNVEQAIALGIAARLPLPTVTRAAMFDFGSESSNVLDGKRRYGTMLIGHDDLLERLSGWAAGGQSISRHLYGKTTPSGRQKQEEKNEKSRSVYEQIQREGA